VGGRIFVGIDVEVDANDVGFSVGPIVPSGSTVTTVIAGVGPIVSAGDVKFIAPSTVSFVAGTVVDGSPESVGGSEPSGDSVGLNVTSGSICARHTSDSGTERATHVVAQGDPSKHCDPDCSFMRRSPGAGQVIALSNEL